MALETTLEQVALGTQVTPPPDHVTEVLSTTLLTSVGCPGPQGPPGVDGSAGENVLVREAGEALGGHRVVTVRADGLFYYASSDDVASMHGVVGVTRSAVAQGDDATVVTFGSMSEGSWSWVVGVPVLLGVDGVLTQTPPASGFIKVVGFPLSATEMFVDFSQPVVLV